MARTRLQGPENDLHRAIQRGDLAAVRDWIAAGKSLEARDPTATIPLALAAYFNKPAIFGELLEAGAATTATDDGNHVLFYAAWRGNRKMVQALLDRGADVNFRCDRAGNSRQTALLGASKGGHLQIVKLLIEHGADASFPDYQGQTALDRAVESGHSEIVKYLKSLGAAGRPVPTRSPKPHPGEKFVEAARAIIGQFPALAVRPEYAEFVQRLAETVDRKPNLFANPDAFEFGKLKGVFAVEFSARLLAERPDLIEELADAARDAGGTLVEATLGQDRTKGLSCVLYPTTDKVAIAMARETSSNGTVGADFEDIAKFLVDTESDNPFRLTVSAGDAIAGEFFAPLRRPTTVAKRLLALNAEESEFDLDDVVETLKREGRFVLWWD